MASNTQTRSTPWWVVVLGIGALILLVWMFFAARNARDLAASNEERLLVGALAVDYVPGGPERFAERFSDAIGEVEQEIQPDELLWTTLIVANRGLTEAQSLEGTVALAEGLDPVLAADLAGFENLDVTSEGQALELSLGDVGVDDTSLVFMGFNPANVRDVVSENWASFYGQTVDTITISSAQSQDIYYGDYLGAVTE